MRISTRSMRAMSGPQRLAGDGIEQMRLRQVEADRYRLTAGECTRVQHAADPVLGRKIEEQKEAESLLIKTGQLRAQLNHRQLALLTHALKHPGEVYRVAKHQAVHNVVYQTARADLLGLEELGLLVKLKQGNAFVFYAADNLAERFEHLNQG